MTLRAWRGFARKDWAGKWAASLTRGMSYTHDSSSKNDCVQSIGCTWIVLIVLSPVGLIGEAVRSNVEYSIVDP